MLSLSKHGVGSFSRLLARSLVRRGKGIASLVAALSLVPLLSCGIARKPILYPVSSSPDATFARMRERENEIRSLRARFMASTVYQGVERTAQGVLLVRKPDRFRLRLVLPFGLTLFDYLSVGEEVWTVAPFAGEKSPDLAPFSRQDLGAAFLRGADAFPGECKAETQPRGVAVACRECDACPVLRTFLLDPGTATVFQEVGYGDGGARVSLSYDVQREVDGHLLPFHIHLRDLVRGAEVDIRIQAYEVNPELRDALFLPAAG
jgi:hypothetical protein